jgi:hypothetical protein
VPRSRRSPSPWPLALPLLAVLAVLACARREPAQTLRELERVVDEASRERMVAFESAEAFQSYAEALLLARDAHHDAADYEDAGVAVYDFADDTIDGELLSPDGALSTNRSVTNTQEAAVDEGGVVKMIGDHLVVLRRGRLFSVDLSGVRAEPVDAIDIAPGEGHDAWYDELLVTGDTALVVGYSYDAEGSELLRFRLDSTGRWHRKDAWVLRSSDYYSSRNYASRLVGERLVMYTQAPLRLDRDGVQLPELARWDGGRLGRKAWAEVMSATDVHRPVQPTTHPLLHVVIQCDLRSTPLQCEAQAIVGPWSRTFYVSTDAVYLWVHDDAPRRSFDASEPALAALYRLPFDGSALGALRAHGAPIDQLSFKEHQGQLAVVLHDHGLGDAMLAPERAATDPLSLLRVPVSALTSGVVDVEPEAFVPLPSPGPDDRSLVNRFVGEHLLYGQGDPWQSSEARTPSVLHVVRWVDPKPRTAAIAMLHGVERIEPLGEHALVVGGVHEDLHFSSVSLEHDPRLVGRYVQQGAAQGETRSHGFFYARTGEQRGILGLPVRGGEQPGWAHLVAGSSGVVYLAVDQLSLAPLGALAGGPKQAVDDRCRTSCIDWYGSSRPLFVDDRVFALLGYELVEGRVRRGRIEEVRRADLLAALRPEPPKRRE